MKHTTLLGLFFVIMVMSTGIVAADVSLSVPDIAGSTTQGVDYVTTITVENNGDPVNLSFSTSDLTGPATIASDDITVSPSTAENVGTGEAVDVTITIPISDDQPVGTYTGEFIVAYDNGTVTGTETSTITLEVQSSNHPPVFTSTPSTTAIVGAQYSYQATASDDDGDDLTFSLVSGPAGMSMAADGLLTWTPTTTGEYEVNISVSDGEAVTYQSWTITVSLPGGVLQFGVVTVGSSSQERGETVSETFTISNPGSVDVTNLQLSSTAPSEYEVTFSVPVTTVPAGGSVEVTIQVFIPDDQDAGTERIGTITASGVADGSTVSSTQDLELTTANHLFIADGDIIIDGRKRGLDDGDSFDVKPGDEVEIKLKIENDFDENIDIEDIDVTIEQDDLDWDETESISRIRDGDDDTVSFVFTVPVDADEDDSPFTVEITVEGEDENGALHGDYWEFDLELDKERDELTITDLEFSPSYVTCSDTSVRLLVTITNTGRDDQDEGVLRVQNEELGIDKIITGLVLDEGDEITEQVVIPFPRDVREGEYVFDVRVYTSPSDNDLTDLEVVTLSIGPCTPREEVTESAKKEEGVTSGFEVVTPPLPSTGQVVQTVTGKPKSEVSFTSSETYLVLLIVVIILLVVLIALMIASLRRSGPVKK